MAYYDGTSMVSSSFLLNAKLTINFSQLHTSLGLSLQSYPRMGICHQPLWVRWFSRCHYQMCFRASRPVQWISLPTTALQVNTCVSLTISAQYYFFNIDPNEHQHCSKTQVQLVASFLVLSHDSWLVLTDLGMPLHSCSWKHSFYCSARNRGWSISERIPI
jgi:hypothetical protein